jgi:hypothetical protein
VGACMRGKHSGVGPHVKWAQACGQVQLARAHLDTSTWIGRPDASNSKKIKKVPSLSNSQRFVKHTHALGKSYNFSKLTK